MLSSHVKRSLLLWLHIKLTPFDSFCEMIYYFIDVYIINRILHDAWRYEISLLGLKNISLVRCTHS